MISPEPLWRLLVADDHAQLTELDEAYRFKNFYAVEGDSVERLVAVFESLWASGTDYELPVRGIPAIESEPPLHPIAYWDEAIAHLASHPTELRELKSAHFERLVAELLRRDGMDVQLTPPTHDGVATFWLGLRAP